MEASQRAAVVVELCERMAAAGSWCGETHIQKALYFVQELTGVPTGFGFVLYKFGPFSFDLRESLNVMLADGLLALQIREYPYGPSLAPTEAGKQLCHRFDADMAAYVGKIGFVVEKLGSKGVAELERLATALLVWRQQDGDWANLEQRINKLKPHVSLEKAGAAVDELRQIVGEYREREQALSLVDC